MNSLNLFLYLLVAAALMPTLITVILALKPVRHGRPFGYFLAAACLWILALPAGLAQAFHYMQPVQDKGALIRMAIPILAAPFNIGGVMTRLFFQAQGGSIGQFSHGGAIATFHTWFLPLAFHVGIFGTVFEYYFRRGGWRWRQWPLAIWAAVALANSLSNAAWPWWGAR